jgi:DNA-binding XRE family transcriptional regulator
MPSSNTKTQAGFQLGRRRFRRGCSLFPVLLLRSRQVPLLSFGCTVDIAGAVGTARNSRTTVHREHPTERWSLCFAIISQFKRKIRLAQKEGPLPVSLVRPSRRKSPSSQTYSMAFFILTSFRVILTPSQPSVPCSPRRDFRVFSGSAKSRPKYFRRKACHSSSHSEWCSCCGYPSRGLYRGR